MNVPNELLLGVGDSEELRSKKAQTVLGNLAGIEIVYDFVERQLKSIESLETSDALFEEPNWPYRQAKILGEKKAWTRMLKTLKFSKGM